MNLELSRSALAAKLALCILLLLATSCQRYQPRPVNLAAHHQVFLDRTPNSPEVQEMARRLAQVEEPAPFDLSDGVSLTEAEAVAMVFNSDLRIARARAGVALASADQAGLWQDPVIGVDLARILKSVEDPWKVSATLGFTIPISGRLSLERSLARSEHAASLAEVADLEWRTRMNLRRAWLKWAALTAHAKAMQEFAGRVDDILKVVGALEQAGEIARNEARLFRIERVTRAAEFAAVNAQRIESELEVKHLMGLSPSASIPLTPVAAFVASSPDARSDVDRIESGNTGVAISRARYQSAERSLQLEIRKQYPDLNIGPGLGWEDGQTEFLLGFSIPISILNANRQAIARANAEREVARIELETALEAAIAECAAARANREAAKARRELFEQEVAPLVDEQYNEVRRIAELGEINTLVLLETIVRQHEAKVQ